MTSAGNEPYKDVSPVDRKITSFITYDRYQKLRRLSYEREVTIRRLLEEAIDQLR